MAPLVGRRADAGRLSPHWDGGPQSATSPADEVNVAIPDLEGMLRRVVLDVFDDDVEGTWDTQDVPHAVGVTLGGEPGSGLRTAHLYASASGWFEVSIPELGVGTFQIEYDDEGDMAEILRELALVANAYLRGEGLVEKKRGILRTRTVLTIAVDGSLWTLRRPLFGGT